MHIRLQYEMCIHIHTYEIRNCACVHTFYIVQNHQKDLKKASDEEGDGVIKEKEKKKD